MSSKLQQGRHYSRSTTSAVVEAAVPFYRIYFGSISKFLVLEQADYTRGIWYVELITEDSSSLWQRLELWS